MDSITIASSLTRYAMILVDVPNVCARLVPGTREPRWLRMNDIDWPALFSFMLASLDAEQVEYLGMAHAFAAVSRSEDPEEMIHALKAAIGDDWGPIVVESASRDIDSKIVNALWVNVIELSRMQAAVGRPFPHEVTVLLASGDYIYGEAIRSIRSTFGHKLLDLRLHTFAWQDKISTDLRSESDKVVPLDSCRWLIKPP